MMYEKYISNSNPDSCNYGNYKPVVNDFMPQNKLENTVIQSHK